LTSGQEPANITPEEIAGRKEGPAEGASRKGASMQHPVRVGTCGWSYADWCGVFYPNDLPAAEFLPFYAERFRVVEVDSTFYRSPSPKTVSGWRQKTPEGFDFSLKVPQTITHEKVLLDWSKERDEFLAAARLLEEKLLCCVLQFAFFNKHVLAGLPEFLDRLDPFLADWPADVPVAVEIRNEYWFTPEFTDCLRRHNAVWCLSDQACMPSPLYVAQRMDPVTGPFGYIRLLGDRAEVDRLTSTLDHTVIDRADQIYADAQAIQMISERVPVLAFVVAEGAVGQ
jgi:uncharacterized protein YecE (DUF72 family)